METSFRRRRGHCWLVTKHNRSRIDGANRQAVIKAAARVDERMDRQMSIKSRQLY